MVKTTKIPASGNGTAARRTKPSASKPVRARSHRATDKAGSETGVGADESTKLALLEATAELLSEKNNLDFSLAEVGAKAGMSPALVPYHFGSKHGLLSALLEWSSSHYVKQINGLMAMNMSALDKLRLHVRGVVVTYTRTPYLDRLLHHIIDASDDVEARRISDFYIGRPVAFYRALIEQGVAEGTFRPVDPTHLYFVLIGTGDHLVARRKLLEPVIGDGGLDDGFTRNFGDFLHEIVLTGLAPR